MVPLPKWGQILFGVLLLDLTFYYWHWLNHNILLFWRFHNIHHIDPDLDISTSFRFHFVEIAYTNVDPVLRHAVERLPVGEWLE